MGRSFCRTRDATGRSRRKCTDRRCLSARVWPAARWLGERYRTDVFREAEGDRDGACGCRRETGLAAGIAGARSRAGTGRGVGRFLSYAFEFERIRLSELRGKCFRMSAHKRLARSRRDFLFNAGSGLGALALGALLDSDGLLPKASAATIPDPLKPKPPHFPATAKSVIWLFMEGGPSHVGTFVPKPALTKLDGQAMPASFGKVVTAMGTGDNALMACRRSFKQYGQSGIWISDWYPEIA